MKRDFCRRYKQEGAPFAYWEGEDSWLAKKEEKNKNDDGDGPARPGPGRCVRTVTKRGVWKVVFSASFAILRTPNT